jgi:hypothetical protein
MENTERAFNIDCKSRAEYFQRLQNTWPNWRTIYDKLHAIFPLNQV